MTTTISPRIGMRVILHLTGANGRVKREHLPPEFSGVIFAWDSDGVGVSFLDHFGIGKVVLRVPLLAQADNDGGYVMWCRPAPGEPEAGAPALPEYLRRLCVSGPIYAHNSTLPPKPDDSVTQEATPAASAAARTQAPTASCALSTDLAFILNMHSAEAGSDTPDFILSEFLLGALDAFEVAVRARDERYGAKPGVTVTTHSAGGDEAPSSGPKWSLKQVDTASMLAELRSRGCQAVTVAGEDVETLKEQATAWREVVKALDDTLGDWLHKGQSAAHSAVSQIHYHTAQAKAWVGVAETLTQHWPEWTHKPTSGPACAVLAIADMAKQARGGIPGTWDGLAKSLIARTKRDGCHSTARTVWLEGELWWVSVGPNNG